MASPGRPSCRYSRATMTSNATVAAERALRRSFICVRTQTDRQIIVYRIMNVRILLIQSFLLTKVADIRLLVRVEKTTHGSCRCVSNGFRKRVIRCCCVGLRGIPPYERKRIQDGMAFRLASNDDRFDQSRLEDVVGCVSRKAD